MSKMYTVLVKSNNPDALLLVGEGSWESIIHSLITFEMGRLQRFSDPCDEDVRREVYAELLSYHSERDYKLFHMYNTQHNYPFVILPQHIEMSKYDQ